MNPRPDPLELILTFTAGGDHVEVRWEADVLGVRTSAFRMPFPGDDLALVVRALDVAQYPNYPAPGASAQQRNFTFSRTEQARLAALGLWDAAGRVQADAPRRVGRALYHALCANATGAQALGTVRDHATATGASLALRLRFPPDAVALAALPWELLWDDGPAPLLLSRGTRAGCTRHLDLAQALPPPTAATASGRTTTPAIT